jgi:hypothetical protein
MLIEPRPNCFLLACHQLMKGTSTNTKSKIIHYFLCQQINGALVIDIYREKEKEKHETIDFWVTNRCDNLYDIYYVNQTAKILIV